MPDFAMPALKPGENLILSDGERGDMVDVFTETDYGEDFRGAIRDACEIWEALDDRRKMNRVIEVLVVGPEHGTEDEYGEAVEDIRLQVARFGSAQPRI